MRSKHLVTLGVLALVTSLGCDTAGASLQIRDARASRDAQRRVVVDIDVRAHESLGGNIGTYCTKVTFTGQTDARQECKADLEDGDTKTIRMVSDGDLPEGAMIVVRVRLAAVDDGRTLFAPPR
jgi:hypothetical protein